MKIVIEFNWWKIVSRNGKTIATSETYSTPSKARRAARNFSLATGIKIKER